MNISQRSYRITTAVLFVALLQAAAPARAQLPRDPVERAKVIARNFEANARQLTLFDREGKQLSQTGERDMWGQPTLSPDGKRIAVGKQNLDKECVDIWVLDVATGKAVQLTSNQSREFAVSPAWSTDGGQVAYAALRAGYFGLYRKASNGEGAEELLYRNQGGLMTISDWSMDGQFLSFSATDLSGGALYALPLNPSGERKPVEILRSQFQLQGGRFSPDSRLVAYLSNESGRNEVYVRRFDAGPGAAVAAGPAESAGPWQISDQGGQGMISWRNDGKELYYLAADRAVMAVSVTTSSRVEFGKPKVLFRTPEAAAVNAGVSSVSRDGERIVIAIPPSRLRQLTVFDRAGNVVSTIGQPGLYAQPALSPDGKHVVVTRNDPKTSNQDIWTFDLATGQGTAVTNDTHPDVTPIWSPDGKSVAYVSTRKEYSGIYRKASDGTGDEELLFRYTPGAFVLLTDWSSDGRFLTFHSGGVLLVVPLRADEKPLDRQAIEWMREEYDVSDGEFSPDGRFVAFLSNESDVDKRQVCVRPFDSTKPNALEPAAAVQVSKDGSNGMLGWRRDGKELYYVTRDREVMAVDITTTPKLEAGTPKLLFKLQSAWTGRRNVSRDGERFIFSLPVTTPSTR